ncbi:CpaE family protein [uncultured Amnibacterium sp.]|uniref:AAA family ATPase n=1 Tax=uncultured Amnibacterium sp. TaxID=1631851 RepID=UPI0035CC6DC0
MTEPTPTVLCLAPHVEDRLLPRLAEAGLLVVARPPGAGEGVDAVGRLRPGVLIVSAEPRHLDSPLLTAAAVAGAVVVVLAEGEWGREHAASLGVREPLDADATADDIAARIAHGMPEPAIPVPTATAPSPGRVTAVWGPAGAPGRTTTAIALASELAAAGLRVALVDADTIGAAVAPSLGLLDEAPGLAAACRLAAAGALTGGELDRIAQHHRCARGELLVLTGIGRPDRWPELSADRVTKVLEQCRSWADHTIVDTGFTLEADEEIASDLFSPRRNAATLAALRAADTVVAVGAGDPIGLARYVRAFGDLVEIVDQHRVRAVVGKVRQSAVGLGAGGQIRASLQRFGGIEEVTLVPSDPAACDAALLTARTLPDAAPRSAATAALRRFTADHLLDRPVRTPRRTPSVLRRLRPAAS